MANIRNRYLLLSDTVLLFAAPFVAYAIRFAAVPTVADKSVVSWRGKAGAAE